MKISFALFLLSNVATNAFVPMASFERPSVNLMAESSEEAVAAAMAISEKFGKSSPEAAAAWETVEEIDASISRLKAQTAVLEKPAVVEKAAAPAAPIIHADTTEAVENALEASKLYGATSQEARVAWDIVEELDAANSRHRAEDIHVMKMVVEPPAANKKASTPSLSPMPSNAEEAIAAALLASRVYGRSSSEAKYAWDLVEEFDEARSRHSAGDIHVKAEPKVEVVVKTPEPTPAQQVHKDTSKLITAALAASKEFGKSSPEAALAWELVEEVDATNAHHKTTGSG
jgi:hypothetical protein